MDILESLEVRWFFPEGDAVIPRIDAWFAGCDPEGTRVDHYLVTGRRDLGVKARAAAGQPPRVETKYLLGAIPTVELVAGAQGTVERWRKLSVVMDDPSLMREGTWIEVDKLRRLRRFSYDAGSVTPIAAPVRPTAGCGVEWTRVQWVAEGTPMTIWTLGFEAFGPPGSSIDVLLATARLTLAEQSPLALPAARSLSYPAWIEDLAFIQATNPLRPQGSYIPSR